MANSVSAYPWIFDTVSVVDEWPRIWCGRIVWVADDGTDSATAVIKDSRGNTIAEFHHNGTDDEYERCIKAPVHGLKVTTLSTGKLYVYFD